MAWVLLAGFIATPSLGQTVRVVRLDGTAISGQWRGGGTDTIELSAQEGDATVPLDDIMLIDLEKQPVAPAGPHGAFLHDGGILHGQLVSGGQDSVEFESLPGRFKIGWNELAAIRLAEPTQFRRAHQLFQEARQSRSPSQDTLVSRDHADVKVLEGRLETLDPAGGSFVFAGETRKFQNEKLFGIIFAAGAAGTEPPQAMLELADGSSLGGRWLGTDDDSVRVESAFGAQADITLEQIRFIRFRNQRVQFLSDLKPDDTKSEGILHTPWAVGSDTNVLGRPISIEGRTFERGLGVHSRTELSYSLNAQFQQFAATIGIDDSVRPLGDVVMRIEGDGRVLFDSGPLTGAEPPRDILIDVQGVQTMKLVVDYGDGLDASDHANWADARLIRPRAGKPSSRS